MVAWEDYAQLEAVPQYLAAVVMVLLAAALVWLEPGRRATISFGLFLVFRALRITVGPLEDLSGDAGDFERALLFARVGPYFAIAAFFAFLAFVTSWPRPRGWFGTRRGLAAFVAVGVALEIAYLIDHGLYYELGRADGDRVVQAAYGPLYLLGIGLPLVIGLASLLYLWEYSRSHAGPGRTSLYFVAVAFALNAAYDASAALLRVAPGSRDVEVLANLSWVTQGVALAVLAAVPVALGTWLLVRFARTRDDPEARFHARRLLLALPLPVLSAALVAAASGFGWGGEDAIQRAVVGAWRLALPLLASYALVKYQLFGIDLRIRATVKGGTVAGAFVATFFVVSESAAYYFTKTSWGGRGLGLVAAGLLVFALHPLQRVGDRLARAALPAVDDTPAWRSQRREEMFRAAVEYALMDGQLTIGENRRLARMADRLGLSVEEAWRVQRDVERALGWLSPRAEPAPRKAKRAI